jgi:hypothetical protein
MSQVKAAILFVCDALNSFGCVDLTPEDLRQSKFNQSQTVCAALEILFHVLFQLSQRQLDVPYNFVFNFIATGSQDD